MESPSEVSAPVGHTSLDVPPTRTIVQSGAAGTAGADPPAAARARARRGLSRWARRLAVELGHRLVDRPLGLTGLSRFARLPRRQNKVICAWYGICGERERSLDEIGAWVKRSRRSVMRLRREAEHPLSFPLLAFGRDRLEG